MTLADRIAHRPPTPKPEPVTPPRKPAWVQRKDAGLLKAKVLS